MWEFLTIVDETHDDPTLYPVLSGPDAALPVEWEESDGPQPASFRCGELAISQRTTAGWTQTSKLAAVTFEVLITGGRVVIYCEKFTKGGGWRGFGIGGLAFAAVANTVSHARAAARRRGKLLVAHVRYPWLVEVNVLPPARKGPGRLRLIVDAGAAGQPRLLALDLSAPKQFDIAAHAAYIAQCTAVLRLHADRAGQPIPATELEHWTKLAANPGDGGPQLHWAMPGHIVVGEAGSLPVVATSRPS